VKAVVARQVIVRVDQAGQYGVPRQIDKQRISGNRHICCVRNADDLVILNDDNLTASDLAIEHVDELPCLQIGKRLVRLCARCSECKKKHEIPGYHLQHHNTSNIHGTEHLPVKQTATVRYSTRHWRCLS